MTNVKWIAAIAATAMLLPVLATAESLKEKQQRLREEELLQDSAKLMNETCKTNIKAVGDWASFKGALTDKGNHHVGLNCGYMVLDVMKSLCDSGQEARDAIKAGVTSVRC